MDLNRFDSISNAEKGVELILEEKTSKNDGAAITLYGADSARCKELEREIFRRNSERRGKLTAEEIDEQTYEKLVNATKGWRGILENGKELDFSPEAADKLYRNYPEIADRVTVFIYTRANFFTTASKT